MNYKLAEIYYGAKSGKDINKEWFVYYYYKHPTTGKFVRFKERKGINRFKSIKERTEQAKLLQQAINEELRAGFNPFLENNSATDQRTFVEALAYALEIKKKFRLERTYIEYKSQLKFIKQSIVACGFDTMNITEVSRRHIKPVLYHIKENNSINTYNKYLSLLKSLFSVLVDDEIIEVSPVHGIKNEKKPETVGYKTLNSDLKSRVKTLMYEHSFAFGVIGEIIYDTGIRPKEILNLKWENINQNELTITVIGTESKNQKTRIVPIRRQLLDKILLHYKNCNNPDHEWYLFGNKNTLESGPKPFHRNRLTEHWHNVVHVTGGIDSSFKLYGLKHTGSDDKIMAGLPIEYLKDLYGHHSTKMTRVYAKKMQEKAAQVIRDTSPDF
jgi:site-specific recombinase XerD